MTWVKLDDQFFTHPKALAAGRDGRDLFIAGLCYCSSNLTDGSIPKNAVPIVAALAGVRTSAVKATLSAGLWSEAGDHYLVHDYLEHQSSKEKVEAERQRSRQRKERFRERQRNGGGNGRRNGVPNGQGTLPERALEAETETDPPSAFQTPPADALPPNSEEDLTRTCRIIAGRKLQARRDQGQRDPNDVEAWLTTVIRNDLERLRAHHDQLREQHPGWTDEQLADDLDPDSAPRLGNYMTAEETDEWLAEQERRQAEAVPMPEHMRPR